MKHIKRFLETLNEKIKTGDFVNDYKFMIVDIIDVDDDVEVDFETAMVPKYIEYIAYEVDEKSFYLLDPDLEIIDGPYPSLEEIMKNI